MIANKIFSRAFKPLLSRNLPMRSFFKNDKEAPKEPIDNAEPVDNVQQEKPASTIKLAEFTEDELNTARLHHKTMLKTIEPYRHHNHRAFEKLANEVETLYREKDSIPSLKQEIKSLEEINKLNHEKLQKAVDKIKEAEQESFDIETRLSKELDKSKTYAISKFSHEVLEIVDNLELCMENLLKNKEANKAIIESDFYEGIELTYKHALGLFRRYGIHPIEEGIGHKMDPNVHDVLFIAKDEAKPEGEIIHVAKKGYRIGERVLRASKVGVIRND